MKVNSEVDDAFVMSSGKNMGVFKAVGFNILSCSVVHNGEISSYGTNKRYLEMWGYRCSLLTDTEIVAYALDLLVRRHKLPLEVACMVLSQPIWEDIEGSGEKDEQSYQN